MKGSEKTDPNEVRTDDVSQKQLVSVISKYYHLKIRRCSEQNACLQAGRKCKHVQ